MSSDVEGDDPGTPEPEAPVSAGADRYPCPECGANTTYSPGAAMLHCEYCGSTTPVDVDAPPVAEQPLAEAMERAARGDVAALAPGGHEVECKTCGAHTVLTGQARRCPFCDGTLVVEVTTTEPMLTPQGVLPFKVERATAKATWATWLKTRWFAPSDLAARAEKDGLDGCYLPYWTFDSHTITDYRGQRGDYYYVTESYTDSQGNRRTRQVRRTRWRRASGRVEVPFDDVLVPATEALPGPLVRKLEPWDTHAVEPFDGRFLAGFVAARYTLELRDAFPKAEERMDPVIRGAIRSDIGGDEQRISAMSVRHQAPTFKHVLMPLWVSSYRYKGRLFRTVVNARTGELAGERPYSAVKITLFVLAIIAAIVGIVLAVQAVKGRKNHAGDGQAERVSRRDAQVTDGGDATTPPRTTVVARLRP